MYLAKITGLRYGGSFSWHAKAYMAGVLGVHEMQAWEERHQNREVWKRQLDHLRELDQCYLARLAVASGDIVAGLRDKVELEACRKEGLFDHIVWIERPGVPADPTVTYAPQDCDEVILNLGTLEDYHNSLWNFADRHGLLNLQLGGRCV